MKIEQTLCLHDPDAFLKGNYEGCFTLIGHDYMPDEWIDCGKIELEVNVDSGKIIDLVVQGIEEKIIKIKGEHHTALNILERRLGELTALPAPEQDEDDSHGEESRDEIHGRENAVIDKQELS